MTRKNYILIPIIGDRLNFGLTAMHYGDIYTARKLAKEMLKIHEAIQSISIFELTSKDTIERDFTLG